jgi:hypothetical protein
MIFNIKTAVWLRYYIWRTTIQPPQQRFFLFPLRRVFFVNLCVDVSASSILLFSKYTHGQEVGQNKQHNHYAHKNSHEEEVFGVGNRLKIIPRIDKPNDCKGYADCSEQTCYDNDFAFISSEKVYRWIV